MDNSCRDCRKCSYVSQKRSVERNEYAEDTGLIGHDYFCTHPELKSKIYDKNGNELLRCVQRCRYTDYPIPAPTWCPYITKLNELKVASPNKNMKQKRTNQEILQEYKKVPEITKWEDIEEGEVYHYPPLLYEKRSDYLVIRKNDFHIYTRQVAEDGVTLTTGSRYFYKSDKKYKFLVKHKIKEFDVNKIKLVNGIY